MPTNQTGNTIPNSNYSITVDSSGSGEIVGYNLPLDRVCAKCGVDFVHVDNGYGLFCPRCKDSMVCCYNCGNFSVDNELKKVDGSVLCQGCYEHLYFTCMDCKKMLSKVLHKAERYDIQGEVCHLCAKEYEPCQMCKNAYNKKFLKSYADEHSEWESLCKGCLVKAVRYIKQNPTVSADDVRYIADRLKKKKVPSLPSNFMFTSDGNGILESVIVELQNGGYYPKRYNVHLYVNTYGGNILTSDKPLRQWENDVVWKELGSFDKFDTIYKNGRDQGKIVIGLSRSLMNRPTISKRLLSIVKSMCMRKIK